MGYKKYSKYGIGPLPVFEVTQRVLVGLQISRCSFLRKEGFPLHKGKSETTAALHLPWAFKREAA